LSKIAQLPIKVVTSESQARLISDPMRQEILRLLSRRVHTAKELSEIIGLTPPSIGHHLKTLVNGELVSIVRQEPESHGIMQKWYQADAQAFIVDKERLSNQVRRYFMPMDIERARSVSACLSIINNGLTPSSTADLENLTHKICKSICKTAEKFSFQLDADPEKIVHRLYVDALRPIMG
jgi:DNA-binding transcriptional ArsR family regulator